MNDRSGRTSIRVDGRSVGELLLDADLTSRDMLYDPNPGTAKARTRTWGEVVEAAADLWSAIPDRSLDKSMARIHQLATTLHRTHQRTGWPGPGDPDPHLERITNDLTRAAELISTRRHPTAALSEAGHLDSEAARTRIMHTLYVGAHGVGVAIRAHARDLEIAHGARGRTSPGESLTLARDTLRRVTAVESLAGSYLHTRWPATLTGEHRDPVEPARLEQALTRWDLQAHRTLAAPPTAANLLYTSTIQRDLAIATEIITSAAAHTRVIDPQHADRLRPALARVHDAWTHLQTDLQTLAGRRRRLDPELLLAGNEVRAALREITHDHAGLATPARMATTTDLGDAARTLQRAIATSVDLAHVLRDALAQPELTVASRGAHALTTPSTAASHCSAWVDAGDLHHDRPVTLPPPARHALVERATTIIGAVVAADSAGTFLDQEPASAPAHSALIGRPYQDRTPPSQGKDAPGPGCER